MLTATDGDLQDKSTDKFRIKIWDFETEQIIYDNQMGDADDASATMEISGGNIVIHQQKNLKKSGAVPALALTRVPEQFMLYPNAPNPFNPDTKISFDLPHEGHVVLALYDLLGNRVSTLIDSRIAAGCHTITWNSTNHSGRPVASGVYLVILQSEYDIATQKMTLIR